jgi:hypothetical protein
MRICWLSFAKVDRVDGVPTSTAASTRYRILLPSRSMARSGQQIFVASLFDFRSPAAAWAL